MGNAPARISIPAPPFDAERKMKLEAARLSGETVLDKTLSRRDFLRGNFLGI